MSSFQEFRYEKNDQYLYPPVTSTTTLPTTATTTHHGNNLNINVLPENNAILRLEVELRDKHTRNRQQNRIGGIGTGGGGGGGGRGVKANNGQQSHYPKDNINYMVPMEKVSIYNRHITVSLFRIFSKLRWIFFCAIFCC